MEKQEEKKEYILVLYNGRLMTIEEYQETIESKED